MTNQSISASIAAVVALGMLVVFLPATSGPSDRKTRTEAAEPVSLSELPVATARGLRGAAVTGHTGIVVTDEVSYVRKAPPPL